MSEFIKICSKNEVGDGKGRVVEVKGKNIAVMNDNGKFFAVENECKHMQGPLGEGECSDGKVTCPWHGWEYDLKTGKNTFDEDVKLKTYEVKVQGNDILVKV
mgnify:CR=1 FL=1